MSISGACRLFRLININKKCVSFLQIQERNAHRWFAPTMTEIKKRQEWKPLYRKEQDLPSPRNTHAEWNLNSELYAFKKRLNEDFKDDLLLQAFTHKSYLIQEEMKQRAVGIENPEIKLSHNEKLIEEGEEFMKSYISAYLCVALPKFPSEGIEAITDHLTSTETLGHIGLNLGCRDIILAAEYPVTVPMFADTFKALVGALIASSGEERTALFVRDFVITQLSGKDVNDYWNIEDPVSMLEGFLKKAGKENVEYRLITQSAVNTLLACYRVGLYIDREHFATGFGETVAIAKEMTARDGLRTIFGTQQNMPPLNFKLRGVLGERKKSKEICSS